MKEFKKWLKGQQEKCRNFSCYDNLTSFEIGALKIAFKAGFGTGRKVALKQLYNKLGYSEEDKRIKDIIDKELEE